VAFKLIKPFDKKASRDKRHRRIRRKVAGTAAVPRLCVHITLHHIYAQVIDDEKGVTLAAASTLERSLAQLPSRTNVDAAKEVGQAIANKAAASGITQVVFDRGGRKYHGRVMAFADAARAQGLEF
jgi:large subunit ribosomal protein L18